MSSDVSPSSHTLLMVSCLLGMVSCQTASVSTVTRNEPINKPDTPWVGEVHPSQDISAETEYILQRRKALGLPTNKETVALCFSGGGLRSATIQLGVLQGLEDANILKNVDYLSSVSGGSYTSSWFVSHLLPPGHQPATSEKRFFRGGNATYTSNRRTLLQLDRNGPYREELGSKGAVDELEQNRGFVFGKGNIHLYTWLPARFAVTIPVNLLFDVGLHWKPTRGKFNWHHPTIVYESAIRQTYLIPPNRLIPGQDNDPGGFFNNQPHELLLKEVNPPGNQAPYLVINAALANTTDPQHPFHSSASAFEFSRDSCGAPCLGYIHSRHFGFPVEAVQKKRDGSGRTMFRANAIPFLPSTTKPLRLSTAVAASGAAFDANGGGKASVSKIHWPPGSTEPVAERSTDFRVSKDTLQKPLNLNLRQQQRNFSMEVDGSEEGKWNAGHTIRDRVREVTMDRAWPSARSNSLLLTDGGHFEGLAVYSMLQRPTVKEIWSFDAGYDNGYKFGWWTNLVDLMESSGWKITPFGNSRIPLKDSATREDQISDDGTWNSSPVFVFNFTAPNSDRSVKVFFVKTSLRDSDGKGLSFIDENGRHYDDLRDWLAEYRSSNLTGRKFPHTSTANLSFNKDDFAAYRSMGRILAKHLSNARK